MLLRLEKLLQALSRYLKPLFEYDPKGKAKTDVDAVLNELEREIRL